MESSGKENQSSSEEVNDSVEHVSDTALWIATFRARETARPNGAFKDPLAARLAGERGERLVSQIPNVETIEFAMIVRTTAIDSLIERCLADGADTIVNLGAGLDTRPYRMSLPSTLKWIEVDFPHVIDFKNRELANEKPRCSLERISADLSDDRTRREVLSTIGANSKKAAIVTEGVIVYLTNEVAETLARDLLSIPSFAYWIMDFRRPVLERTHNGGMQKLLKKAPFRFTAAEPLEFFESCGWKLKDTVKIVEEAERIGIRLPFVFPWSYFVGIFPKTMRRLGNRSYGFALFSRNR